MNLPNFYEGNYKRLLIIPILLLLPALFFMFHVKPGLEFKGGVQITLELNDIISEPALRSAMLDAGFNDFNVRTYKLGSTPIAEVELAHSDDATLLESSYREYLDLYDRLSKKEYELLVLKTSNGSYDSVEREVNNLKYDLEDIEHQFESVSSRMIGNSVDVNSKEDVQSIYSLAMEKYRENIVSSLRNVVRFKNYSFKLISPSLGQLFTEKIKSIMFLAAILSSLVIFIMFRDVVPSIAVLMGASADVIFALGFMGFTGIPLSLATIASLLMLIGYSLDTDVLITIRILERGLKDPRKSAFEAFKTGFTMSFTSILAFASLFLVGMLTNIVVYQQIANVVLVGLFADIIFTWLLNAIVMLIHVEGVNRAH